jgi:hypothetical protein
VRVDAPHPRGDTLDGAAHAGVHTQRFEGPGSRRADAPAPPGVTLDAIAEYADDGTLVVALLDAHDGPHALVALAFPPQRGPVQTLRLDAPGPLEDGDAALTRCAGALWAVTATDVDLAVQRVLPTPGDRTVLWRGEAAREGHVIATACDGTALLVALQRAPALAQGSLVVARVPTS